MQNQSNQQPQSKNEQFANQLRKSGLPIIIKDGKIIITNQVEK